LRIPLDPDAQGAKYGDFAVLRAQHLRAGPLRDTHRSERLIRGEAAQLSEERAPVARVSAAQSEAQGTVAYDRRRAADGEPAIQIWIARNFPRAKLLPSDPWQALKAISILSWCSYLSRLNAPSKVCDAGGAEQGVIQAAKALLFENYKIADDMLAGHEFFFDHFTAADAHFFWCLRRGAQLGAKASEFPN
jgi:hypothetical protein